MKKEKRKCDECTACCEGWLTANIHGHEMRPGVKCHFLGKTCSIYPNRPENPCKQFKCEWLADENNGIPEWIKPSQSGIIITTKSWGNNRYYWFVVECGKKIESDVLHWLILYCEKNLIPLEYQVNGNFYRRGPKEFIQYFEGKRG
jgi:hypothetical protein